MAENKKYLHNLDVENNKVMNLLLNPLTTAQRTTIGGTLGLSDQSYVCYDTDLDQQYFWDGTAWITTGGGSVTWGSITGTITAQTDLTAYLAANYYPLSTNPAGYLSGSGTATRVAFWSGTNTLSSDVDLYWDNVNKRLAIGTNIPAYGLDVNKDVGIRGFTTTGGGQLGSELLTASGWTSTGWTGSFVAGWTHTPGNTSSLLNSLAALVNSYYVVNCTVSGDTSFAINYITFGGVTSNSIVGDGTYNFYLKATSTASLAFVPDLSFDGTVTLSVKLITQATSSNIIFKNSSNVTTNEIRISQQTANVFIGTAAGARHVSGSGNVFLGNGTGQNDLSGVDNVFIGSFTGAANATGTQQVFIGSGAGNSMTIGNGTVIIGAYAGRLYGTGVTTLKSAINSIYLGSNTRASADGNTNEIVIGSDPGYVLGLGSNTTRIGSNNTISTYLAGRLLTGSTSDDLAYQLQLTNSQYFARFTTSAATNTNAIIFAKSTSSYIGLHGASAERKLLIGDGPAGYANFTSYNTNIIQFSHSTALGGTLPTALTLFSPDFIFSTGTNTHTINDVQPVINLTGGTNTLRGYYYHPTVVAGSASPNTHIAFENTIGDIIHGNLAGSGTRMVTADSTGKLSTQTVPSGGIQHATASGTDTYTATVAGVTSYTDGDAYIIQFTNGNTTGCTLNINGLGAIPLYRNNDSTLIGGDIQANGEMLCVYDATVPAFRTIGTSPNTLLAYVTNDDSVSITKGQAVYAFSGTGDRMTVKLANNTSDATSAQTVGLVLSSSIGVNQKGFIIMQGLLDQLSILPTATWADGDPVYLGSTAGSITKVKPYAPNHLVYLGFVTTASNGSAGRMYVRVQNGYELDELHNVQAQTPTLKDTLWYDNTVSPAQWKTASISTILGYTPFQLPSLTAGSVLFSNGTTIAQDNANFFWDNTNKRLGIAQSTPASRFHLNFNQNSVTQSDANGILLANSTAAIAGTQSISPAIVWQGNGWKTTATAASQDVRFRADVLPVQGTTNPNASWRLSTSVNGGAYVDRMTVTTTGATANGVVLDVMSGTSNGIIRSDYIQASSTVNATDQFLGGNATSGSFSYRTTNAGGFIIPKFSTYNTAASGTLVHSIDNTNGFVLQAANAAGNYIARASMQITSLTNTTGSESGDMIFLTQNSGTAMTEQMRIFGSGNVAIGTTASVSQKLYVNGNIGWAGTSTLQSLGYSGARGIALQIGGTATYKTTNAGSALTPVVNIAPNGETSGAISLNYDFNNGNGLNFAAGNGTSIIARAGINITNLTNTAGSESGDLIFLTQSGGTAMSEKMRIFGGGNVGIGTSTDAGFKLDVNGTTRLNGNLTTNITTTQIAYSSSGILSGSANLYWDNTNNYLVNRGYYFFEFPLTSGCGLVGRQQGTSNLLFQMGFNAQAQYGGTLGTVSGNQFFVYNFQGAGGAANYYWGFNNSGDNYWGSSNTLYSVKVQQPAVGNIPLAIQGQTSQTARLLTITSTSAGTVGDVMSVFANGNIGINQTTDAGFKLDVNGATRINSNISVSNQIKNGTSSSASYYRLTNGGAFATPQCYFGYTESNTVGLYGIAVDFVNNNGLVFTAPNGVVNTRLARAAINITNLVNTAGSESGDMIFLTQSGGTAMSEKMRITSDGKVGIGSSTNYNATLQVSDNGGGARGIGVDCYNNSGFEASFVMRSARGTISAPSQTLSGDGLGFFGFRGYSNSGSFLPYSSAYVEAYAIDNITTTSAGAKLVFATTPSGSATSAVNMTINGNGNIQFPATNTAAGTTGNQTINKTSGTVNIAAAGTTITVTNSLVTASSIVFAVIRTNDSTAVIKNVVPGAGSFVINLNAAATAETSIGFFVIN